MLWVMGPISKHFISAYELEGSHNEFPFCMLAWD